jgi:hypothetical protein
VLIPKVCPSCYQTFFQPLLQPQHQDQLSNTQSRAHTPSRSRSL